MGGIVRISTSTPWEPVVGYSRAVKAGEWVSVSGTTATDERGALVGIGQMYVQARQAMGNVAAALSRLGLGLDSVVRTRIFVTDISRFNEVARAHRETFGEAPPATSMVEVRRLVHPDMLIEIEAEAYGGTGATAREAAPPQRSTAAASPRAGTARPKPQAKPKVPQKSPRQRKKPAGKPARRR